MGKDYIRHLLLLIFTVSCAKVEETDRDRGLGYQPLRVGGFWEYKVRETIFYGEDDSETKLFYYRDQIISEYFNRLGEQVFWMQRRTSEDTQDWSALESNKIGKGTYRLGNFNYADAAKVVHQEEDDLLTLRDFRHGILVKGVGLVESYDKVLHYCLRNDCVGKQIVAGWLTHLTLMQYG